MIDLGINPHCHVLVTDGCFYGKGMLRVAPSLQMRKLEAISRHRVLTRKYREKVPREKVPDTFRGVTA